MELFKLLGKIAIENQEANDEIDVTTDKAESSSGTMVSAFKKIGGAVAAAFAVDKIVDFGTKCIETSASLKALNSQYEQTFGELKTQADSVLSTIGEDTGILESRMKTTAVAIYGFAKSSGADSSEAMSLMETSLMAAADAAAYYDTSLETAGDTLMSFLKGNFANDAALGVSCTETTRNAKAMELFGQSYQDLSEIQKQQTLLKMVTDSQELSGAMGQAARESSGWENVLGNLKATWNEFLGNVGAPILEEVIPVIQQITSSLGDMDGTAGTIGNILAALVTTGVQIGQAVVPVLLQMVDMLLPVLLQCVNMLLPPLTQIISAILPVVLSELTPLLSTLPQIIALLVPILDLAVKMTPTILQIINMVLPPLIALIVQFIENILPKLMDAMKNICDFLEIYLIPGVETTVETVEPAVSGLVEAVKQLLKGLSDFIGGIMKIISGTIQFWLKIFSGDWKGAWNEALKVLEGFKNMINGLLRAAFFNIVAMFQSDLFNKILSSIKNCVSNIKSAIKLPHFKLSGSFSLKPPSVPSVGVEWYAKGGIMNDPTAFGINPVTGKTMVGGESGAEAIAPIALLQKYVSDAVQAQNAGVTTAVNEGFARLISYLQSILPEFANMRVVMNNGALVGELAPGMNDALGILANRNERGV